jgi:hypothetical protein
MTSTKNPILPHIGADLCFESGLHVDVGEQAESLLLQPGGDIGNDPIK